jgi:hypothetical protein
MGYRAPDCTLEQIENGRLQGYDPNDLAGSLPYWDMAPDDTLAAAAVIHDEMYTEGGPLELCRTVDLNFERDCMILARAVEGTLARAFEEGKAVLFSEIVFDVGSLYWSTESRNTPTTREQGRAAMMGAKCWINECAARIGEPCPYPEAA